MTDKCKFLNSLNETITDYKENINCNKKSISKPSKIFTNNSDKDKNSKSKNNFYFNGKRFKRNVVIVEEEVIFKKKIISIFHEDKSYENSNDYGDYLFSNNNEKKSKRNFKINTRFCECFHSKRQSEEISPELSNQFKSLQLSNEANEIEDEFVPKHSNEIVQERHSDIILLHSKLQQIENKDVTAKSLTKPSNNLDLVQVKKTDELEKTEEEQFLNKLKAATIKNRYNFVKMLGEGTFGKVISCLDLKENNTQVAVKICRKLEKYRNLAKHEIELLIRIKKFDPKGENFVIIIKSWFEIDSRVLMIFPQYGEDLYRYLKSINHHGMKLGDVRHISWQMWRAIDFLHRLTIVHADIKPENLLFVSNEFKYISSKNSEFKIRSPVSTDIVLIDLGNSIHGNENKPRIVVTRYYRPPEVYLEIGWNKSVDIWSMGCVMFELYSGRSLFQCHEDLEHLWMMQYILKDFPEHMIKKSKYADVFFDKYGHVMSNTLNVDKLQRYLQRYEFLKSRRSEYEEAFVDLLNKCLVYNPDERISTKTGLQSPFFT